jgi:hypothetical protein
MNERRNEKEKVFYIGLLPMEDYKTPRGIWTVKILWNE